MASDTRHRPITSGLVIGGDRQGFRAAWRRGSHFGGFLPIASAVLLLCLRAEPPLMRGCSSYNTRTLIRESAFVCLSVSLHVSISTR